MTKYDTFLQNIELVPDAYEFSASGFRSMIEATNSKLRLLASHTLPFGTGTIQDHLAKGNFLDFFSSASFESVEANLYTSTFFGVGVEYNWTHKFTTWPVAFRPERTSETVDLYADPIIVVFVNGEALNDETEYDVFSNITTSPVIFIDSTKIQNNQNFEVLGWNRDTQWHAWHEYDVTVSSETTIIEDIPAVLWDRIYVTEGFYSDLIAYYRPIASDPWKKIDPYRCYATTDAQGNYTLTIQNYPLVAGGKVIIMNNASKWEVSHFCTGWETVIPLTQENERSVLEGEVVVDPYDPLLPLPVLASEDLLVLIQTVDGGGNSVRDKLVPIADFFVADYGTATPSLVLKTAVSEGTRIRIIKAYDKACHFMKAYKDDIPVVTTDTGTTMSGVIKLPQFPLPISPKYTSVTLNNRHIHAKDWVAVSDKAMQVLNANAVTNFYVTQCFRPVEFVPDIVLRYDTCKSDLEKLLETKEYYADAQEGSLIITDYNIGTSVSASLNAAYTSSEWESLIYTRYYRLTVSATVALLLNISTTDMVNRVQIYSGSTVNPENIILESIADTALTVTLEPGTYLLCIGHLYDEYTAVVP